MSQFISPSVGEKHMIAWIQIDSPGTTSIRDYSASECTVQARTQSSTDRTEGDTDE